MQQGMRATIPFIYKNRRKILCIYLERLSQSLKTSVTPGKRQSTLQRSHNAPTTHQPIFVINFFSHRSDIDCIAKTNVNAVWWMEIDGFFSVLKNQR